MTPSNPSPDTGAGTPLTAEEERAFRASLAPLSKQNVPGAMYVRLLATLDAARDAIDATREEANRAFDRGLAARPATDPAGLDARRLARAMTPGPGPVSGPELIAAMRIAREYARLSVADGPTDD